MLKIRHLNISINLFIMNVEEDVEQIISNNY